MLSSACIVYDTVELITLVGYLLDSGNRSGDGLVGRSPWTARDALVPLPEAEAGASARARAPNAAYFVV
jgi:hypothetical protein